MGLRVATILIAASLEPRSILERMLAGHDLVYANSMQQAEQNVRERTFDLIICTILFDDSRMFDLLRFAKSLPQCQQTPCSREAGYLAVARLTYNPTTETTMAGIGMGTRAGTFHTNSV